MPLTDDGVRFLRSERAQAALGALASEGSRSELELLQRLRGREGFAPDEAGWLLDQLVLRRRAQGKLPQPDRSIIDVDLEMQFVNVAYLN